MESSVLPCSLMIINNKRVAGVINMTSAAGEGYTHKP